MEIVLFEPEIPPNTGNIARLCAATNTPLHLIEPLGFKLEDKYLRRAGLDYWQYLELRVWDNWTYFYQEYGKTKRIVFTSARQGENYSQFDFQKEDLLVFGPESRGLPEYILAQSPYRIRIPLWGRVRSLNLSTSAGIILYEAYRQVGYLESL